MDKLCQTCEFWIRVTLRSGHCTHEEYWLKTDEDEYCDDFSLSESITMENDDNERPVL